MLNPSGGRQWTNPSKRLVDKAIDRWNEKSKKKSYNLADNVAIITVMLDPPGPPRAQVLKKQREVLAASNLRAERGTMAIVTNREETEPLPPLDNPGLSIISRFPNAANIKERNLADPQSSTSAAATNRVLNRYRDHERGLCRLSGVARLNNKLISESSKDEPTDSDLATTVKLSDIGDMNDVLQSDEISSTLRSPAPTIKRSTRIKASYSAPSPETPKLSRELSALQLTGSASQLVTSGRRGRTRSASESHSDTENEAPNPEIIKNSMSENNSTPTKKTSSSRINPRFVKSKEAKVQKSAQMSLPTPSTATTPTTVMSLRPRGISEINNSATRKRKPESVLASHPDLPTCAVAAKSPKMSPTVIESKPVMTRSRTAKVLRLKK